MEAVQENGSDDSGRKEVTFTLGGNSQEESTMISTLIIPDRTIPCSQHSKATTSRFSTVRRKWMRAATLSSSACSAQNSRVQMIRVCRRVMSFASRQ
ncbi:hypothetical protein DPMN_003963 [Dreissena polymorpha]|uniref:Uncharacterized protein n=1 Tax=Dreissena polymorpha TaxID=45954 RepID=A0A9D4RSJ8_DREPO|nr:hypothetical protein DPMN_003963 [Dreissena polymorpha]